MEINQAKGVIEAILFSAGREVKIGELMSALEINSSEIITIIESMKADYQEQNRGLQIINVGEAYQLCTKQEYYEYLYAVLDKRNKPNLSQAALETLAIIAYNPRITRAEIETIRGVGSDAIIYKLLDYNLIKETGKLDAPGRPGTYGVSTEFFRIFGFSNLDELPELPRYKVDENKQIVIDEIIEENSNKEKSEEQSSENSSKEAESSKNQADENSREEKSDEKMRTTKEEKRQDENLEAPMPEREGEDF